MKKLMCWVFMESKLMKKKTIQVLDMIPAQKIHKNNIEYHHLTLRTNDTHVHTLTNIKVIEGKANITVTERNHQNGKYKKIPLWIFKFILPIGLGISEFVIYVAF